jgi:hypothetical protein
MTFLCALGAGLAILCGQSTQSDPVRQVGIWLVLAPAEWEAELAPMVAARAAQGWSARFLALEDALAAPSAAGGADAPERLKKFLHAEWRGAGLTYVLLAGDCDVMPVRFMMLDRVTEPAFDCAFYASDLYYADLARADGSFDDWNARADGIHARYFGEVHGEHHKDSPINFDAVSYLPEIAVGRLPVSTREDLRAIVAKILAWQAAPAPASALFVHAGEWADERKRLGTRADELAAAGWSVTRQFFDTSDAPTPDRVLAALTLLDGFALTATSGVPTVGDAWCAAVTYFHAAEQLDALVPDAGWYPPAIFFQGMKFILYGDPASTMPRVLP